MEGGGGRVEVRPLSGGGGVVSLGVWVEESGRVAMNDRYF